MSVTVPQLLQYAFMSWTGTTLSFYPLTCLIAKNRTDSDLGNEEVTIPCLLFSHQKHAVGYA
jgi:hypothetical protein